MTDSTSTGHCLFSSPSGSSAGSSVLGPPCFLTQAARELEAERKHSPTVKYLQSFSIAPSTMAEAPHNAGKFCTAALDDTSGAGQKITSSHCTLSLCGGGVGVLSGKKRRCVPFVFISNCLNPCSFHRGGCAPGWACGVVKRACQLAGKKLSRRL